MEYNIRGPDGELRELVVQSKDGIFTCKALSEFEEISFKKGTDSQLLIFSSDGKCEKAHCAKVGDTWWIHYAGRVIKTDIIELGSSGEDDAESGLSAPMPGTILEVLVEIGDKVSSGQSLLVMEAMKMEHRITAPFDAIVDEIHFSVGDRCDQGSSLISLNQIDE